MLRTVSAALATPTFAASAKLVADLAVISITLTTLIATSSSGSPVFLPGTGQGNPRSVEVAGGARRVR